MYIFTAQAYLPVNLHIGFCAFTITHNFINYPLPKAKYPWQI